MNVHLSLLIATAVCGVFLGAAPPAEPKIAQSVLKPLEAVLEKALAAYHDHDATAFFADFAKSATPPAEARVFGALFVGVYHAEFGACLSKQLNAKESVPDANFGVLVYDAVFEREKVTLSANFMREAGAPKLVQIRMEKR